MESNRQEQIEALQAMAEYLPKLKKGMTTVADELKNGRLADTDEYLKSVINGLNWVISITNSTINLLNEKEPAIDKDKINKVSISFSEAYKKKDYGAQSDILTGDLMNFILSLEVAVKPYI